MFGTPPPTTRRFCVYCLETTTFKFNPLLTHSECIKCKGRETINKENLKIVIEKVIESFSRDKLKNKREQVMAQWEKKLQ